MENSNNQGGILQGFNDIQQEINPSTSMPQNTNTTPPPVANEPVPNQPIPNEPVANTAKADSLSMESLNDEEKQEVMKLIQTIDLATSDGVLSYGVETQQKIAKFCDQVLNTIQGNDLDNEVAKILTDLAVEIKYFDAVEEEKPGFLAGLLGGLNKGAKKAESSLDDFGKSVKNQIALSKKETDRMQGRYESVAKIIDAIVVKLEEAKVQLIKNVTIMDSMYNTNLEYYKELTKVIIAGKEKLKLYSSEVEQQKSIATSTNDQMEIQKLNEMNDIYDKFDKKLDDLTRSRLVSIQNAPQIRLIQRGSEQLIYQIQNSILTAIPVWKSQMVISLGIANNKTALGLQKHITDTTNELLIKNSELLKQGALEIAEESEKGLVSLETLQITNENLIQTINGVMEIQKRGKEERKNAEVEIKRLEEQIKETLLQE